MNILPHVLMIILSVGIQGCCSSSEGKGAPESRPSANVERQHRVDVKFLREEEKLARDVYKTLYQEWNLQIFQNISESEQRHMDRMGELILRYGIEDPIQDDSVGVFANDELQALYHTLVKQGKKSEIDALVVGATIEDLDIRDIRTMKKNTQDSYALDAFAKLACGSRNHMRAFTRQLAQRGEKYRAQYLAAEEIELIVQADKERCGQGGKGRAQRQGGRGQGGRGAGNGRN